MNQGQALLWRRPSASLLWLALAFGGMLCLAPVLALASPNQRALLLPALASTAVYIAFVLLLRRRIQKGLFGEIGFIFVSITFAYTLMPAITFLLADMETSGGWVWEMLTQLLPDPKDLAEHLWRHVLFLACTAASYLLFRGHRITPPPQQWTPVPHERSVLAVAFGLCVVGAVALSMWSAPVVLYVDHYTRFDHLGWFELRMVYVFLLLKTSAYFFIMVVLFRDFQRYRLLAVVAILAICAYELRFSLGQRIETLAILMGAACLYHHAVRPLTLKAGLVGLVGVITLFSIVEVVRMLDFGGFAPPELDSDKTHVPASELGTVFFTGFHLYAERAAGTLPPASPLMLINDLLAVIPFVDHEEWHPMYWYARHYFPESIVPPATVGPIADSAVWGGELDLALRAAVIGALYAAVMRWFIPRRDRWWAMLIFAYLFATTVMTLKHTVLYQLAPLVRVIAPGILFFWLAMKVLDFFSKPAPARRDRHA